MYEGFDMDILDSIGNFLDNIGDTPKERGERCLEALARINIKVCNPKTGKVLSYWEPKNLGLDYDDIDECKKELQRKKFTLVTQNEDCSKLNIKTEPVTSNVDESTTINSEASTTLDTNLDDRDVEATVHSDGSSITIDIEEVASATTEESINETSTVIETQQNQNVSIDADEPTTTTEEPVTTDTDEEETSVGVEDIVVNNKSNITINATTTVENSTVIDTNKSTNIDNENLTTEAEQVIPVDLNDSSTTTDIDTSETINTYDINNYIMKFSSDECLDLFNRTNTSICLEGTNKQLVPKAKLSLCKTCIATEPWMIEKPSHLDSREYCEEDFKEKGYTPCSNNDDTQEPTGKMLPSTQKDF